MIIDGIRFKVAGATVREAYDALIRTEQEEAEASRLRHETQIQVSLAMAKTSKAVKPLHERDFDDSYSKQKIAALTYLRDHVSIEDDYLLDSGELRSIGLINDNFSG